MAAVLGLATQVSATSARTRSPPMRLRLTRTESLLHPDLRQFLCSLGWLCLVWLLPWLPPYNRLVPSSLPVTVGCYGYRHTAASLYDVPSRLHFPLWKCVHRAYGFLFYFISYGTLSSIRLYSVCGFSHIVMYIGRSEREAKVPAVLSPLTRRARYTTYVYTILSPLACCTSSTVTA